MKLGRKIRLQFQGSLIICGSLPCTKLLFTTRFFRLLCRHGDLESQKLVNFLCAIYSAAESQNTA